MRHTNGVLKTTASLVLIFLLTTNSRTVGQQEELVVKAVTESLYVMTGAGCNVVFLVTEEGILVVDSGERPSMTEKVLAKIRGISNQPVRYLVLTHYHHIVGAAEFPSSAVVISHENTRTNIPLYKKILIELFAENIKGLESKAAQLKTGGGLEAEKTQKELELRKQQLKDIEQQRIVSPQMTFSNESTLYLGGKTVQLLYFGRGHTDGDILVHFPSEKTIAVGDLLYTNGWVPRLDGDAGASVDDWLKIFTRVAEMDVEKIIPGHGEVVDKERFDKMSGLFSEYLTDLKAEVRRYIERGASMEEIKLKLKLPKYQHMGMAEMLLPWNIEGACKEILSNGR